MLDRLDSQAMKHFFNLLFWFAAKAFEENYVPSAHQHLTILYQGTSPQGGLVGKPSTCRISQVCKDEQCRGRYHGQGPTLPPGHSPRRVVAVQPAGQASLWSQPHSHMLPPLTLQGKDDGT